MPTIGSSLSSTADTTVGLGAMENVAIPLKDTEVSHALPASTKRFAIQNRGDAVIKLAYTVGESGTKYWTLFPGQPLWENALKKTATITLYFQASKDAQVLEVMSWV